MSIPKRWFINQAKCLFIKTAGNYCKFTLLDNHGECLDDSNNLLAGACLVPDVQANPNTCRRETNQILEQISKNVLLEMQMQSWNIIQQINLLKYNHPLYQVKLILDDDKGCIELSINDLASIQCASPINRLACVSITNPTQFCQFNANTSKYEINFNIIVYLLISFYLSISLYI